MKRFTFLAAGTGALIALACGWYVASPWWTLWRMREAAQAGDLAGLARYADFAAATAQARAQAQAWTAPPDLRTDTPQGRAWAGFLAGQRARIAQSRIGPADIQPWMAHLPLRWGGLGAYADRHGGGVAIERRGIDEFQVRDPAASLEYGPLLTFHRHGLAWKLVAIRWGQQ
jgi:hypothetical protein